MNRASRIVSEQNQDQPQAILERLEQNLVRLEQSQERLAQKLETVEQDITELKDEVKQSNEKFANYQQATQWVVQLAFIAVVILIKYA